MFARMPARASQEAGVWRSEDVTLWAGVLPWESDVGGWSGPRLLDTGRYVVAADANLFDVDVPRGPSTTEAADHTGSADLLARLLSRYGLGFVTRIDGDCAFAVWDKLEKRLILARDRWGQRPLAFAPLGDGGAVFGTSPMALLEHGRVSRALDLDYVAAAAAHLVPPGDRCAWKDVRMIPAGVVAALSSAGSVVRWERHTAPRYETSGHQSPMEEAALELRFLLERAVDRRVPQVPRTAIWMSGGYDSPAVYAAGRSALRRRAGQPAELVPVSLSYPEGDRGREDELIREIAALWKAEITWVSSTDVSLLDGAEERARRREDPFAHPFEPALRALAKAARACGCRVVLDGNGGDQLFSAAEVTRADALQTGDWGELYRQFRRSTAAFRQFARSAILPLLGPGTREWISVIRGRPLKGYWDSAVPVWMRAREPLARAARAHVEPEPGESLTAFEARFLITHPHLARVISWTYAFGLEEGIALRSPLLDRRVVEFIARRPSRDRFDGVTSKLLLREAVRGLLPDRVLASRPEKTGTPVDYVRREYGAGLASLLRHVFGSGRRIWLVDLGVVHPRHLEQAIRDYERQLDYQLGHRLMSTVQAEWWVAAQMKPA
jgi:asparagine synthase (glutamine-hydrolysing)